MRRLLTSFAFLLLTCATCSRISEAETKAEDAKVVRAREEFLRGLGHIRDLQYSDALAAFERSANLRPHAVTTYNIGACLRAMGQYTMAHRKLNEALKQAAEGGGELSDNYKVEAK